MMCVLPPGTDTPIDPMPFGIDVGTHSEEFVRKLLEKLRQSPDVSTLPTHTFIPKSVGRRYSKLATSALDWWMKAATNPTSVDDSRAATLFLNVFDYLVSRDDRPPQNCRLNLTELPKEDQTTVAQQIRK